MLQSILPFLSGFLAAASRCSASSQQQAAHDRADGHGHLHPNTIICFIYSALSQTRQLTVPSSFISLPVRSTLGPTRIPSGSRLLPVRRLSFSFSHCCFTATTHRLELAGILPSWSLTSLSPRRLLTFPLPLPLQVPSSKGPRAIAQTGNSKSGHGFALPSTEYSTAPRCYRRRITHLACGALQPGIWKVCEFQLWPHSPHSSIAPPLPAC